MTNAQTTSKFFNNIDNKTEATIVSNIAKHYGTTSDVIYDELYDSEAEALLDYVTVDRAAVSFLFNQFKMNA